MLLTVPILRIPFTVEDRLFLMDGIERILDRSALTQGIYTEEFERAFSDFSGARHAIAVSSGTAALELMLTALKIQGGSVIVPTNTFTATALAAVRTGSKVIFADSCSDDFGLDPEDVLKRWQRDTQAVIAVHVGGLISKRWDELLELCQKRGIPLLEDCAHAHGCTRQGRGAGTLGTAGAFSFYPTKPLTTGEGGMVTTLNDELAERMRILRNQGKDPRRQNRISEIGTNWRLSEITALFGVLAMRKAKNTVEMRQQVAKFYRKELREVTGISFVGPAEGTTSSYYKFILWLDQGMSRDEIKKIMRERHGVALTGEVYAELCHTEPVWQKYSSALVPSARPFVGAEKIRKQHICLPIHPDMTPEEMKHVVESLKVTLRELRPRHWSPKRKKDRTLIGI